jgi:ubiquinone/menaquinone biosynthesis C-methylase UbiE
MPPSDVANASLFDQFAWVYAFCREHVFRDDTEQIARALELDRVAARRGNVLELGCGPGFYACQLAAVFHDAQFIGIDRSAPLLAHAQRRATAHALTNCRFDHADIHALPQPTASVDAIVASRLFTVLHDQPQALAEMFRVLRPGGRCFIAEPRGAWRTALPLQAMWLLARCAPQDHTYGEPRRTAVLSLALFGAIIAAQPWQHTHRWHDRRYQYAVCVKGDEAWS